MMAFQRIWANNAEDQYNALRDEAETSRNARRANPRKKASKAEGLFKQVHNCIEKLLDNPRHPSLNTHKFDAIDNPYDPSQPVFEAYAQNRTPGAYRVFWCYGPERNQIAIVAITSHP